LTCAVDPALLKNILIDSELVLLTRTCHLPIDASREKRSVTVVHHWPKPANSPGEHP
jgi:hypothetical protein